MKQAVRFANRHQIIAVFCVLTVLAGLSWIASGVSSQSAVAVEPENSVQIADARALGTDSLKRFGALKVSDGDEKSAGSPRVALAADFNADGFNDLLVAHNNRVVLHRGNVNAFAPQTKEAWEAIRDGRFVAPFDPKTRSTSVPAAADFIFSGDFNRDARLDAAFAALGDNALYVLDGDGRGNFSSPRRIETAGAITVLASGDVNRADGLTDLIAGTRGEDGFGLQVFSGLGDIFAAGSFVYDLPAQAEAIAVGQLNENKFADIAVGTNSEVIIFSSKDSAQKTAEQTVLESLHLSQPAGVKSIVTGDLMPDRDNRTELAVLSPDGTIRILARGALDTRPVSAGEHLAEQVREYQAKGYPVPDRILERLTEEDFRKSGFRVQGDVKKWTEAESLTAAAPNAQLSAQAILTTGRLSDGAADDLIVLDQSSGKVLVMPFQLDYSRIDRENTHLSFDGRRAVQDYDAGGSPVAVLALKLNHDNDQDLLVFKEGSGAPSAFVTAPQATFTVTSAVDAIDNNLADNVCNTASNGCTLRAAIMQANRTAGDDTIMINAGVNPTISLGQPDNDGQGTNDQATGDLDITCAITNPTFDGCNLPLASNDNDLSIIGAVGGNTVSAGTFTAYPVNGGGSINTDRVFDVGQDGIFGGGFGGSTGISATFTNLTIQDGNVREALNTALGGGNFAYGGGIRFDGFRSGGGHGTLTLSNSTINSNESDNAGGGVYQVFGSHTADSSTYSNNITKAGEGGGLFFGAATSNSNVSITGSQFVGNEARQGVVFGTFTANADGGGLRINADPNTVTVTNTNFTSNIAQQDGGAIKTLGAQVTITGGTMTGNTARRHGGVAFGDEDTANSPAFVTFTGSTMRGNTANSDNAIFAGDGSAGDGGAIFRDRGTLNITNTIIGGTGAGQPNTATNGGGVAHAFTVDSAAGNTSNQTAVTIDNGSIVGNIATNDGGGVYHNANLFDSAASILSIGATTAVPITDNTARNNGGGIHVSNAATATLNNMTLRSNRANSDNAGGGDGGALYHNIGTTTFTGTLTVGGSGFANQAVNGGGIRNNAGTVNIPTGASITHNTATGVGGGISNLGTLSALATPTITNNMATGAGGGIHNTGTLGAITGPALNFNSASNGGGIFNSGAAMSITSGSVSNNTATSGIGSGGGIEQSGSSASIVSSVTINNNTGTGIVIATASSLDATSNTITGNTGDGIIKTGTGTGSHFNSNTIHSNGGIGIDLSDNNVTPNDANDTDAGPNNLQNFPVINWVRRGNGIGNVTLNAPNGKYRIQYYKNAACDSSGHGEGEVLLISQVVDITSVATRTFTTPALAFDPGVREQITATATHDANNNGNFDDDGSTSEFSACRQVNTLPTITAQPNVSRQQGNSVSNSPIAAVNDIDQTEESLIMSVNGGNSATVNGVTVSNISVSAAGVVTADIIATCSATNAFFTLRVTDVAAEFNEATLNVAVTTNTAPTVGNYAGTTVNAGSNITVTPDAAPIDNGSISGVTASAAPAGFTGTFSGNSTTGALTITTAAPAGTYTITVTITDNCGATTLETFTLTVNALPTVTAQAGITRQQGSAGINTQIAAVNDADQTEETLAVTIRAVGDAGAGTGTVTVNGVTVSNIAVSAAGVVTADIIAVCSAMNASFTLRVADSNGAFNEASLNVAVTTNTAPTIGTYANTSLNLGGGATVAPTAAPADNGSVSTVTVAAAGFTGNLTVDPTTGAVTIVNANPNGSYTVIVTLTDNCGTTATAQFTLTVSYTMTGTVTYGNTPTGSAVKFVPDVTVTAVGTPQISAVTDTSGAYTLNGLGGGAYTVTPSKTGDVSGIESLDATRIQQHLVGLITLTPNQLIAADVDNNGRVNSLDAARIQQYLVQISTPNIIGQWKFVPVNRQYASISSNLSGQDYQAILIGDVTGNWTAPNAPPVDNAQAREDQPTASVNTENTRVKVESTNTAITESAAVGKSQVTVSLPSNATALTGNTITVPVVIEAVPAGLPIEAFDFSVYYDPHVLQRAAGCSV
jgi:hypothetical protein